MCCCFFSIFWRTKRMAIVVTGRVQLIADRHSESHSRPVTLSCGVVGHFISWLILWVFACASSINFMISISLTNESHACWIPNWPNDDVRLWNFYGAVPTKGTEAQLANMMVTILHCSRAAYRLLEKNIIIAAPHEHHHASMHSVTFGQAEMQDVRTQMVNLIRANGAEAIRSITGNSKFLFINVNWRRRSHKTCWPIGPIGTTDDWHRRCQRPIEAYYPDALQQGTNNCVV